MQSKPIRKLLIANRGEIACRVINTCKQLGILTVAVFSDSDRDALFVKLADEAIHIGPSPSIDSYLRADKFIEAAKRVGADAIHPGYGFLSENAEFAKLTSNSGICFIGPLPETILAIGDKIRAKNLLAEHLPSVPLIPGYNGLDQSIEVLTREALEIGFPVLLKASAGGGGKGMRVVREKSKLREEIEHAKSESLRAFGSDELLIEKYFDSIRHVEIQLIGDNYGNVYHCFERDCSIQRRHQKVIEETPSPCLDSDLRKKMTMTAVQIGKFLKYKGAGTIEFIVDERDKKFYFLEMNTRLQVEHPITELVTGLDLVELQILVAQGYNLSQSKLPTLKLNGHAIECRLYSEDPNNNFLPSIGKIRYWKQIMLPNIRYDTGIETGSEISIYYDPLISKISVWSPTRSQSIQKMLFTLQNTIVLGLITNQSFLLSIMKNPSFMSGAYTTLFIEREFSFFQQKELSLQKKDPLQKENELIIIPFLWLWYQRERQRTTLRHIPSGWRYLRNKNPIDGYYINERLVELEYEYHRNIDGSFIDNMDHKFSVWIKSGEEKKKVVILHGVITNESDENVYGSLRCSIEGIQRLYEIANGPKDAYPQEVYVHNQEWGEQIKFIRKEKLKTAAETTEDDVSPYIAPMPCRILKLLVKSNTNVKKNDALLTMEAMKMEVRLYSRHNGIVKILVEEGDVVNAGTILVKID
ncbi:carbamoyl-phosphate synthase L chain, ATP binding domain-containing protein [Glomus cerebriforme]|uniref:Carbamoyl-phosphate synthase L chain, ATP binding domain-containing protein n=1 Tax=Glomus cerebriforme TaxID=658196 RepID=A0A397TQA6_9GLOM|nr:carbamoyl-phosphate synthase L chain, ATP binding domain-containing protein [Glomus cerebriforme]